MTSLAGVEDLKYHGDGRPKSRGEVKGEHWARSTKNHRHAFQNGSLPMLDGLSRLGVMADRFKAVSRGPLSVEMLREAENVLEAAENAKLASEALVEEIGKIAQTRSQAERYIRQYVEDLRDQVGDDD